MSTSVGGPPVNQNQSSNSTVPAIPNGNTHLASDHSRKPSMTVTPAGASFNANGGPAAQNKPSSIQFGSVNATGSPAMSTPQMAHQPSNSLGVNSLNQRASSPQGSPSPIPQPVSVSGGRPPSNLQAQGNGLSFGQMGQEGNDPNSMNRPVSNMSFNDHARRGSSQSIASDNPNLPTGPGRGNYTPQGGRGRGGGYNYQGQMAYSPHQNFRPQQNGRGMGPGYQGQGRHQMQYQGSPNLGTRSPMMNAANPGTPQMGQMHMMPGVQNQPGYYMGPQVNIPFPYPPRDAVRGRQPMGAISTRGRGLRGRGFRGSREGPGRGGPLISRDPASDYYVPPAHPVFFPNFPLPDLSPESGNFEHFLTHKKQGYGVPTQADPSIQYMYNMNTYPQVQNQYPYAPPQSPRPPYQQPGGYGAHMQPSYSNQGPPSMSRQSSQMSASERPSSGIGQAPHTPSGNSSHPSARTPSMSIQKPDFTLPTKKSSAIVIKNAAGEVVDFKKNASSANTAAPAPAAAAATTTSATAVTSGSTSGTPAGATPAVPTPPSRTPSAADHTRSESTVKSDEEKKKAMQEAVAKKVAEEQAKLKQEKEAADQKAQLDKEAAEAAQREADQKSAEAAALENEAKDAEANKAPKETKPADDEIDLDALEAEMAAIEAEEARQEEEYQKKKAAQKEAQRKKEEEEAAAYEANMKEAERQAEEEELAREKKRAEGGPTTEDLEAKKLFAALKRGDAGTPASTADDSLAQTPAESGAVTPVSDSSMPPPNKNSTGSRRSKVADLTLDTKSTEPAEPSATLKSLLAARRADDPTQISYPDGVTGPQSTLNDTAPANRKFHYDRDFLLQFQNVFKDKPALDWDSKIRESLGDGDGSARPGTARTPSGMGGRNPSNRPAAANNAFTPMGAFGGRPSLPPGTTSEQRFAASNAMRGGPMGGNPFAFGRPGSMGPPMGGRTPSNNPLGSIPGSPRPGGPSRGGQRNESKRAKQSAKQEADANKAMPLTAGLQVTALETSSSGWKPLSLSQPNQGPTPGGDGYLDPDVVQRKVKAALNKMTPEKFDRIADQILDIAAQSKHESDGRTLRQVIQLTFEKATDEAHWAPMYAMFCSKMLHSMSPEIKDENIKDKNGEVVTGGNLFRKYLLNRCQEEFERGWKVNLPGRKEGETEEAAMMSDEYYTAAAAKRRGLGLVKFIGELFKLQMLTERIMHECVKKLVDYEGVPDEAEVESLCSLLRTIGKQLDSSESKAQGRMDVYFERIRQIMDLPELPSRLRFMLLDIVDLRKNNWVSKQDDKGPKTITEIREEAERQAREAEMQRLASQAGGRGGGGGGGRMPMGRGDARSASGYGQIPPPDNSNRVGAEDLRRLGGRSSRNASSTGPGSLGPSSLLGGRTNSGRRGLGPGASFLTRGGEDSNASSRTGTPPAQKEKDKKDESSTNAFSALAALEGQESHEDPSSPPTQKSQPNTEVERSRSPGKGE